MITTTATTKSVTCSEIAENCKRKPPEIETNIDQTKQTTQVIANHNCLLADETLIVCNLQNNKQCLPALIGKQNNARRKQRRYGKNRSASGKECARSSVEERRRTAGLTDWWHKPSQRTKGGAECTCRHAKAAAVAMWVCLKGWRPGGTEGNNNCQ